MSLSKLAEVIDADRYSLVSTDLFDTVLLRDHSTESARLAEVGRRVSARLEVDRDVVTRLRWHLHANAYRAVALTRPHGEARLADICATMATMLGLDSSAAELLHHTEVGVDIDHLRSNRPLVVLLGRAARRGARVVAVSDTYYDRGDLVRMLDRVVGHHPLAAVYSSADLGLTKHAGGIFAEVARREGVAAADIVHVGDSRSADVARAESAGWAAIHLPRSHRYETRRLIGRVASLPTVKRRAS